LHGHDVMRAWLFCALIAAGPLMAAPLAVADNGAASDAALLKQGEYVFRAADCYGCHTDTKNHGRPLAGGRALVSAFGTFYSPNITPDPQTGIGRWSEQDFVRALREGVDPSGRQLYPAFPYPSYTHLTDADLHALWTYLRAQTAVVQANRSHQLRWFVRARSFISVWKALYFKPGVYLDDRSKSAVWNRGAYLVTGAGHCGECHTPRDALGGPKSGMILAGTADGPENSAIPNITPDKQTGIGKWSRSDIMTYLKIGMTPDGDVAGDLMADVINNSLQYLTRDDLAAIAEYLKSLPPVDHRVGKPEKKAARK
jgi:mono/diheme cytochrome c family protein